MYNYLLPIAGGLFFIILVFVVLSNRKVDRYHAYFSLFLASGAVWSIAVGLFLMTHVDWVATLMIKVFYVAALMIGYSTLMFAKTAPGYGVAKHHDKPGAFALLLPVASMGALIMIQDGFFRNVTVGVDHNSYQLSLGPYLIYSFIFVVYAIWSLAILTRKYQYTKRGREKSPYQQGLRLVDASLVFGLSFGAFFNLVLPALGVYSLIWIGPIAVIPTAIIIWYAILRHGLFDIRLIVVRTIGYVLSIITLGIVYVLLAYLVSFVFLQGNITSTVGLSPINIIFALVLAFIFQPVKNFFDRITNNIFYRDTYNPEEFFALLSNVLSSTTDLRSLAERASEVLGMTFRSKSVSFYIRYYDRHLSIGTSMDSRLNAQEVKTLDRIIIRERIHLITASSFAGNREVTRILRRHNLELLLPLWREHSIIGYVALGDSLRSRYSAKDQRVLQATTDELVIAIQNVISLQEVSELNTNLQTRIDKATHSLRLSNEKLRQLDDTKDEFISMASHQLRTPLTSVKGYVSMILDGDAGPINEQQRKFLTEAFDSSNRMAGIIGDFLNVSRLQTGKFSLEREEIDLGEVVEAEVEHLKNTARTRGLTLHYKRPVRFPLMSIDKAKIEQVVMNFIDNAIFYAPDTGAVDIELFQRAGRAVFTVRDHGIGVPKSEQANLFGKFFRATNARRKRPDGTGVGLFLAKKVVVAHKGTIIFESEEGKGSVFGFEIPLKAD